MKKLLLALILPVCFFACKPDPETMPEDEWKKYPEYQKTYVEAMVSHYFSLPKDNSNIVRGITFDNPPAGKFLKGNERMTAFVGAYLVDTLGKKKGDIALIIQIKKATKKYKYYDYSSLFPAPSFSKGICPPPYDSPCPIEDSRTDSLQ